MKKTCGIKLTRNAFLTHKMYSKFNNFYLGNQLQNHYLSHFFTLFSNIYITSHPPLHIWICLLVNKSRKVINKCLTVAAIRLGISGRYPTPDSSLTTMK